MKSLLGISFVAITPFLFTPPAGPSGTANEITIEAGEHSLESLVTRASEFLKLNYMIASEAKQNLSQRIQWTARQSYGVVEFRKFFEKTLLDRGFALNPVQGVDGDQFRIVDMRSTPMAKASLTQTASVVTPEQIEALEGRAIIVTTTFTLRHLDAQRVQSSLRQYLGDTQLERTFNVGSNMILVTSFPDTVIAVGKFLKTADVPPAEPEMEPAALQVISKKISALEKRVAELEARGK